MSARRTERRGAPQWILAVAFAGTLTTLAPPAAAQESFFSLQFLGLSEETGDGRARAQGVLGIALEERKSSIVLNPALHASLDQMTISVMGIAGRRTSEEPGRSSEDGMARFPQARVALPLPKAFVASAGFVGMRNMRSDFALPPSSAAGFGYRQSFDRTGTLYTMPVGVARSIGRFVSVGVTLDFLFGTVDESWTTAGDSILSLRTRRRDTFSGRNVTLGTIVRPWSGLRLGVTVSPSAKQDLSSRVTIEDARTIQTTIIRDDAVASEVRFPATWRAGAAYDIGKYWTVTADGLRRSWAEYDGRLYGAEALGLESRVGAGAEFRPPGRAWWSRLDYRLGFSRTTWPQRVGGDPLRETALHVGTGLDLVGGHGRLDLGFEYGRTGDLEINAARERSWRFLVGFSGQEIWKRRSPRS